MFAICCFVFASDAFAGRITNLRIGQGSGNVRLVFEADSDALIVKGIVALLIRVMSEHTPKEIVEADLYFIDEINLREHLSPTRSNGLNAMLKQMRLFALAYHAKEI